MANSLAQSRAITTQFRLAYSGLDFKDNQKLKALAEVLEGTSRDLTQSIQIREYVGADPRLWPDLRKLWLSLAGTQLTFWDNDDSDEEDERPENQNDDLRSVCTGLAKFTRNLVAGVPQNQSRAFENEPEIRRLLHFYTSWSEMEDSESFLTARTLTQALSNLVTSNEKLAQKLWKTYMNLPEDQVVLIRLLTSPDPRTLLTTLVFTLNCVHGSRKRTHLLTRTTTGIRVCVSLLDCMLRLYEEDEESDGGKAFNIGYSIFIRLIEEGTVPDLYEKFAMVDEIITPHQTTLLKLVDSYLQSIQLNATTILKPEVVQTHVALGPFLAKCFFSLSMYAQNAIRRSLGDSEPNHPTSSNQTSSGQIASLPAELDVMLPKVCEALVLVAQCIATISLEAVEQKMCQDRGDLSVASVANMKEFFIEATSSGQGLVESLIEVLRMLDLFLPRINFGKPVSSSGLPNPQATSAASSVDSTGFSYLKRDLVRLLGVLCHEVRAVQDRIRMADGIPVVMNLCVIDERNPYLREHAIFTLHCLLENNTENQALVDEVKAPATWDENGDLKDLPRV